MIEPPDDRPRVPVPPLLAVTLATVGYVALMIFGLGMTSLALDRSVIEVGGLGPLPGVFAATASAVAVAGVLLAVVPRPLLPPPLGTTEPPPGSADPGPGGARRAPAPRYTTAIWTALGAYLAYVVVLWIAVAVSGEELRTASTAAGGIAASWFGVVLAAAGGVAGWAGIAMVRTRAERPTWPWEDRDEQDDA